jgi:hypothetical protein
MLARIDKSEKTISKKTVRNDQLYSKLFSNPVYWPPKTTKPYIFTEFFDWFGEQDLNRPKAINPR